MPRFRFNDSILLNLNCIQCGEGFRKTLGELKSGNEFGCPRCGIRYEPTDVDAVIQSAEQKVADFGRNVNKIFRN